MEALFDGLPGFIWSLAGAGVLTLCGYLGVKGKKFFAEHTANNQVAVEHPALVRSVSEIKETVELIRDSHLDQIRNSIIRICNEAISQGWIDNHQLRSLCDLYDRYKKLGGNGYVDEMVEHAKSLPVRGTKRKGFFARLFARAA